MDTEHVMDIESKELTVTAGAHGGAVNTNGRTNMKKRLQQSVLAGAVAAAVGGVGIQDASADAVMFPYLAASNTVTTIISVVNHGVTAAGARQAPHTPTTLHYTYLFKNIVGDQAVDQTSTCKELNYLKPSSPEDLVTFDSSGHFGDTEGVMFSDGTDYTTLGPAFTSPLSTEKPARAFLLVDNQQVDDAQLYGEAVVMEFAGGAAWGYRAYNSTDGNNLAPIFGDGVDLQGEVLGVNEFAQFQFMPFDQVVTKFLVTPVAAFAQNVLTGNIAINVQLSDTSFVGAPVVAWNRDEEPLSGSAPKDVVCVASKDVQELMVSAVVTQLQSEGGWSYLNTTSFISPPAPGAWLLGNGAVVYKLEFSSGTTLDGVPLNGVFNNAVQLTDNGSITGPFGQRLGFGGTNGF